MPSAAARQLYEDQIPSFMSVYDVDGGSIDQSNAVTIIDPSILMDGAKDPKASQLALGPGALPPEPGHRHHDSTSTRTTESADSSPTTTVSCTDSSDLSDPSPSSSPDSPVNLAPLPGPGFASTRSFGGTLSSMANLSVSDSSQERPMTSPGPRRPKNMKGLSIQPPYNPLSSHTLLSEPASPSFIKPVIPAMKRKPSQLSLKTNSSDLLTRTVVEVPNSPIVPPILQRRALKHSTSTPHMLSGLRSATFGPPGGMTIPAVLERNETGLSSYFRPPRENSISEEESSIRTQIANRAAYDSEPYHDIENNEDMKSPGYPDGPLPIYDDNVFLYLEPTAEEASRFDVVINVAREVRNPFEKLSQSEPTTDTKERPEDDSPVPDTATTDASFCTAREYPSSDASSDSPTTPKAQKILKVPEYIHVPWDHNTDIVPDLMRLCETIEQRTKEGKKVLVHCQQGASRSASLIIAYGLYRNPELSVNDAYYQAQAKSRWISPNMRLMYCLQDFQKEVAKKKRLSPTGALKQRSGRSPTKHRATMSADNIGVTPPEPLTAPLPEDSGSRRTSPERTPNRPRGMTTPRPGEPISPGPSSAPSSFSWSEKEDESDPGKFGRFHIPERPAPPKEETKLAPPIESFSQPLRSPGLPPPSFGEQALRPPSSPGLPLSQHATRPPPSPRLPPPQVSTRARTPPPPIKVGPPLRSIKIEAPQPSPGLIGLPKSPGFAPPEILEPPMSPGFRLAKPPPSPGFGARRFGLGQANRLTFGSLNCLGASPLKQEANETEEKKEPETIRVVQQQHQQKQEQSQQPKKHITAILPSFADEPLMSPRAETMTSNPIHERLAAVSSGASGLGGVAGTGLQFVEIPPTPRDGVFSPRATLFPRDPLYPFGRPMQAADPRSPPTKGETPIVRSIDEML